MLFHNEDTIVGLDGKRKRIGDAPTSWWADHGREGFSDMAREKHRLKLPDVRAFHPTKVL